MSSEADSKKKAQLELGIEREKKSDRNYHLGGRSFYFFDFDDNIAFLATPLILFHKETKEELHLSSGDFATFFTSIGHHGIYKDYEIDYDDRTGTFRCFRDHDPDELIKIGAKNQIFIEDLAAALKQPDLQWKGPSWECFYHATFNGRPVSVITARGHHPDTIQAGIRLLVTQKYLPQEPNFLSIFPVSHKPTRVLLNDPEFKISSAELKQRAIRLSVETAIEKYGYSHHHRFGMSDDDPRNIELIVEEMTRLKALYPEMSFFMIETHQGQFIKHEVTSHGLKSEYSELFHQLSLFDPRKKT